MPQTVLWVDNYLDLTSPYRDQLVEDFGVRIQTEQNASAGLAALTERAYDAVVINPYLATGETTPDYTPPSRTDKRKFIGVGEDLAARIRKTHPNLPIIFLTVAREKTYGKIEPPAPGETVDMKTVLPREFSRIMKKYL